MPLAILARPNFNWCKVIELFLSFGLRQFIKDTMLVKHLYKMAYHPSKHICTCVGKINSYAEKQG